MAQVPLFSVTEDPALNVLGFHYKHVIPGNNNVVDLSGAVFRLQGGLLDKVVAGFVEKGKESGGEANHGFSTVAFEPRRFDNRRQDKQRNQIQDAAWNGFLESVQCLGVAHPLSLTAVVSPFLITTH